MRKVSNHTDHQVGPILALAGLMCVVTPMLGPVVLAQPPVTNPG